MIRAPASDPSHEWKNGWPVVVASGLGYYMSVTHIYSLGLFMAPIERELGWSREQVTAGGLIVAIIAFFVTPFVGNLLDRFSVRRVALPGIVAYCICLAAIGLTGPGLASWWLAWTFLGLGYCFVSSSVWTVAPVTRFDRKRGLALAGALLGTAACSMTMPLLGDSLINNFGWREAYFGIALVVFLLAFPVCYFFLHDARSLTRAQGDVASGTAVAAVAPRAGLTVPQALKTSQFWKMSLASLLAIIGLLALTVHFIPILTEKGVGRSTAASIAGIMGVGGIIGRLLTGYSLDRLHGPFVGAIAFSLPMLVCLLLSQGNSVLAFSAAALLLGFTLGAEVDVIAYLSARYFGLKNYGSLFGFISGCLTLGAGVGPFIAGIAYERTGSYETLLFALIAVFIIAAVLIGTLGRYPVFQSATPVRQDRFVQAVT